MNCKRCGAALPTVSFGELSDLCSTCRPLEAPAPKKARLADELPRLATTSVTWCIATVVLIAISVVVFLVMLATGVSTAYPTSEQLLRWGADFGPYTLGGQYWRLITSAFLHAGLVHLAVNMVSLWILGRMVEKLFGALITVGLYLVTAIGGGLLSISWEPLRLSAGASGAIFGLDGVLIAVLYLGKLGLEPDLLRRALAWAVKIALINLLYGLSGNINNMAHLGGLVTGLLAGVFLARGFSLPAEDRISQQTRVLAATACILVLLLIPIRRAKTSAIELQWGENAIEHNDYSSAVEHFKKYTAAKPDDYYGHASLGYALHASNRLEEAVPEYQRALALKPDLAWVAVDLADICAYQGKPAEAVALYKKNIWQVKADAGEFRSYGASLYAVHDYAEAETALKKSVSMNETDEETHNLLADVYGKLGKTKDAQKERQRAAELAKTM